MAEAEGPRRPIRILVVDDHTVVRRGIVHLLEEERGLEVVGEAGDGATALALARALRPDVVLMDIGLPDLSGIEVTRRLTAEIPEVRVLILTVYDRDDFLFRALEAGASGYVLKGADVDDLLRAVRAVHAGEVFIYPRVATRLVQDYLARFRRGEAQDEYQRLSPREREVLPLLAEGYTNEEIAARLHLSPYTVQTYRQRIMQKLNLHSRAELLRYALRRGLLSPEA